MQFYFRWNWNFVISILSKVIFFVVYLYIVTFMLSFYLVAISWCVENINSTSSKFVQYTHWDKQLEVLFKNKLVIIFFIFKPYLTWIMTFCSCKWVPQTFLIIMPVSVTQWPGEGRNTSVLHLFISIKKGFQSFQKLIFKFEFLHCLLILLFLLSNGLNATYLNLSNIGISALNAYLANLMYALILFCFMH